MPPTRRAFLSSTALTAATVCATGRVLGAGERLGVAVIGVNGMGHFHVRTLAGRKDVRLVALCDVDPEARARAAKTVKDAGAGDPALVEDFRKLLKLKDRYDLIITFRYRKIYSGSRIFVSWVYNVVLRFFFRTPFRDVSTGLRVVRRTVLQDVELESTSPFIGAELAIKTMLKGYRVGEVGIQTFPRSFGSGSSTSVPNILATIADMWRIYRRVFSDAYDLPSGRARS